MGQWNTYIENEATVKLIFSPAVVPLVTELEKHFTSYELEQVSGLSSAYAVRLYEILIAWRSTGKVPMIELVEFRNRLGVGVNEYSKMVNFKTRVLDLAINQINEHSDITASYEQHKRGRVIIGFSFQFKQKPQEKPNDTNAKGKGTFVTCQTLKSKCTVRFCHSYIAFQTLAHSQTTRGLRYGLRIFYVTLPVSERKQPSGFLKHYAQKQILRTVITNHVRYHIRFRH